VAAISWTPVTYIILKHWGATVEEFDVVLESLTKRFTREIAVNRLSVKIAKGEYLCMLGPSGCGKTTTLRMIAGLLKPDEGNIYLGTQRVNDVPPNKRSTATVFQSFALFPHLTVWKNVEFGLRMRRVPVAERRTKVTAMLEQMRLSKMATKMPEELSMGERQRVALAKSLVIEPRVLLLDEPLSNIDVTLKNKILIDLREIHDRLGLTFIHVTHDPEEAMANADRILLMNKGAIEQLDAPIRIFNRPKSKFVAEFFQISNLVEGVVEGYEGDRVIVENNLGKFAVLARGEKPPRGKAVSIVIRHDKAKLSTKEETQNRLGGNVIGEEIVGAVITYVVTLDDQSVFKFQTHMSLDMPDFQPNERITLTWNPEEATLLP
jgi:ABC-type Fe3+/spermidine/putrescine transport system ATPase subunit